MTAHTAILVVAITGLTCYYIFNLHLSAYRSGFRDAIDWMDGKRPMPRAIVTWRGALGSAFRKDAKKETEE